MPEFKRTKRVRKFIENHKYQITFITGAAIGGALVHKHYTALVADLAVCEAMLQEDMHVKLKPEEIKELLAKGASALVSRAADGRGGSVYITLGDADGGA